MLKSSTNKESSISSCKTIAMPFIYKYSKQTELAFLVHDNQVTDNAIQKVFTVTSGGRRMAKAWCLNIFQFGKDQECLWRALSLAFSQVASHTKGHWSHQSWAYVEASGPPSSPVMSHVEGSRWVQLRDVDSGGTAGSLSRPTSEVAVLELDKAMKEGRQCFWESTVLM